MAGKSKVHASDATEDETKITAHSGGRASAKSAAERFEALEEKLFGGRAARVDGKIERGHGSLFRRLPEDEQRRYLAMEAEVEAEKVVAAAQTALTLAEAALATAIARCEALKE